MKKSILKLSGLALALAATSAWGDVDTVCNVETGDITIAVASNFYEPAQALVADFTATGAPGAGKTIKVCHNATGILLNEINNGNPGYSLFLAADKETPTKATGATGGSFHYTNGTPILWTVSNDIDISNGDVTNTNIVSIAMANPANAPYGKAGKEILQSTNQWTAAVEAKIGTYYDNIALTKAAIQSGEKSVGFIAKAQICSGEGVPDTTIFYEYPTNSYTAIEQYGVVLNQGDTALANAFKTYLTGTEAQDTLVNGFCYNPISNN